MGRRVSLRIQATCHNVSAPPSRAMALAGVQRLHHLQLLVPGSRKAKADPERGCDCRRREVSQPTDECVRSAAPGVVCQGGLQHCATTCTGTAAGTRCYRIASHPSLSRRGGCGTAQHRRQHTQRGTVMPPAQSSCTGFTRRSCRPRWAPASSWSRTRPGTQCACCACNQATQWSCATGAAASCAARWRPPARALQWWV
jgi:hypothetical protein